jgi:hypothetical protein
MQRLSILQVILASLCFESALASLTVDSIRSQLLYRSAHEAKSQCQLDVRMYHMYGESFNNWKKLASLRTADEHIGEEQVSCIANVLCQHQSPVDVRKATRVYTGANKVCDGKGASVSDPDTSGDPPATFEEGLTKNFDPESIQTSYRNAELFSFTAGNLIYLVFGFLIGAFVRAYLFPNSQIGDLTRASKLRRPEL